MVKRVTLRGKPLVRSQARSLAPYSKSVKLWDEAGKHCKRRPSPQAKP